jgi:hypothetical protein
MLWDVKDFHLKAPDFKPICSVYRTTYLKQKYKHFLNQGIKTTIRLLYMCFEYSFFPPPRYTTALTFLNIQIVLFWVFALF